MANLLAHSMERDDLWTFHERFVFWFGTEVGSCEWISFSYFVLEIKLCEKIFRPLTPPTKYHSTYLLVQ